MIPRELAGDPRALVIVDWSWWVRRAWAIGGLDGTASLVCGWLARLLSDPMPPSLVVAVDPDRGWTFRHAATKDLPEERRYKANRPPKPPEFVDINARLLDVVRAHNIPVLQPRDPADEQSWEADDAAAAAARLAVSEGRSVACVTADKDWLQIVQTSDPTAPMVVRWDGNDKVDTEDTIAASYGVTARQMTDLLGMTGDKVDNVPGVRGLGPKGACSILTRHHTMAAALLEVPQTRPERLLHEQRDEAIFSRSLVELWADAPIAWEPKEQAVGDFDVRSLHRLYRGFGFTQLADSIPDFGKERWS